MFKSVGVKPHNTMSIVTAGCWLAVIAGVQPTARADWRVTTVDSAGNVGRNPSLAIDRDGNSHVAYIDDTLACLKYAKRAGGVWQTEIVDPRHPHYLSLAVDSQGRPHIAWSIPDGVFYSHWTGTQWQTSNVCAEQDIFLPSLALTAGDEPRIACYVLARSGGCYLLYATPSGVTWQVASVVWHGISGSRPTLVLDANDHPRIAWTWEWTMGCSLHYYESDGGPWSEAYVTEVSLCNSGQAPPLVLGSSGHPHVLCADVGGNVTRYGWRTATGWQFESILANDVVAWPALALDAFDDPHIAYYRQFGGRLKYTHRTTSGWYVQTVDDSGSDDVGAYPSLAVDPDGNPHIAYMDSTHSDLKYAWRDPAVMFGDLDGNGYIGPSDVSPFVLFLIDFPAWQATYPNCPAVNGDINQDGTYPSFGDINAFVDLLTQ